MWLFIYAGIKVIPTSSKGPLQPTDKNKVRRGIPSSRYVSYDRGEAESS